MLVDVTTELQDVQQAHLNFERCADTGDLRLALQSSMPSLRHSAARFFSESSVGKLASL